MIMHMLRATPVQFDDCTVECFHPAVVAGARARLAAAPAPPDVASLFSVLGDPTRIRILLALISAELCVCDLAAATGLNRSTVSHQLRILRERDLVQRRRAGKIIYYSLADDHVTAMIDMASAHADHATGDVKKDIA